MNTTEEDKLPKQQCTELVDLLLKGGDEALDFAAALGNADADLSDKLRNWPGAVMRRGIVAGASMELIKALVLRQLQLRKVDRAPADMAKFIETFYPQYKADFAKQGWLYE